MRSTALTGRALYGPALRRDGVEAHVPQPNLSTGRIASHVPPGAGHKAIKEQEAGAGANLGNSSVPTQLPHVELGPLSRLLAVSAAWLGFGNLGRPADAYQASGKGKGKEKRRVLVACWPCPSRGSGPGQAQRHRPLRTNAALKLAHRADRIDFG